MAKKATPKKTKQPSTPAGIVSDPEQMLSEVLGCVELTDANLDELKKYGGDLIARDGGLEIHLTNWRVGVELGEKLEAVGGWVRHTVYERGASVCVCLFVKLDTLPSRQSDPG